MATTQGPTERCNETVLLLKETLKFFILLRQENETLKNRVVLESRVVPRNKRRSLEIKKNKEFIIEYSYFRNMSSRE